MAIRRSKSCAIVIAAHETDTAFLVTVTDDGMGFGPMPPYEDGRTHIGISNVQTRLAAMRGGSLAISSKPGVGTRAIITIPKA